MQKRDKSQGLAGSSRREEAVDLQGAGVADAPRSLRLTDVTGVAIAPFRLLALCANIIKDVAAKLGHEPKPPVIASMVEDQAMVIAFGRKTVPMGCTNLTFPN
jgi:hypothetical protein